MKIFSGIRPSGQIHIGNYLGAIQNWLELQKKHTCFFCLVDLHAITTPYFSDKLKENVLELALSYLSLGLDPNKSTLFIQSQIPNHAELSWLLGTITPVGALTRMTQYKTKVADTIPMAGLLQYPVLMAADILLYKAEGVPVGEDQKQHIEFAQMLAKKFNHKFGKIFPIPKAIISKQGFRIKSLQSPRQKMSKTDNSKSYISLLDNSKEIQSKIASAITDSGQEIKYDPIHKPGISNLITIYSLFQKIPIKTVEKQFCQENYRKFKDNLAQVIIESLTPFQKRYKELKQQPGKVREILHQGQLKAQKVADQTLEEVKREMGLFYEN